MCRTVAIYRPSRLMAIESPSPRDWLSYFASVGTDFDFILACGDYFWQCLIEKVALAYWQAVPSILVRGYGVATYTPCSHLDGSSLGNVFIREQASGL